MKPKDPYRLTLADRIIGNTLIVGMFAVPVGAFWITFVLLLVFD